FQPGTVRLWDFESGKEIRAMHGHTESITSVAFSADGTKVVSASWDRTVRLWDVATGKELRRFEGHVGRAESAAITPDGTRVISGGNISDNSLRIWDAATGNQLYEAPQVKDGYFGVAALSNSRQCVSAGRDGAVRVWQWRKGVRSEE
ncbi:MAG TPA: hypothetical protein VNX28_03375, partial [Gemmataceae bacterium]|nr:hypothetical protein [Gemmataceae bacterium]